MRLLVTAGQVAEVTQARALLAGLSPEQVIADKGYDCDALIETIHGNGAGAVIPPRCNRQQPRVYDEHLYQERQLIERYFNKGKNCRRLATRYDKTARNYLAFWQLASVMILLA